ncbi:MAG: type II/IV secretion system protein [Deltaproteobacteria bacterium]|nr:type II/IV secretion system protein [Deltaproteobacteria bacterium]
MKAIENTSVITEESPIMGMGRTSDHNTNGRLRLVEGDSFEFSYEGRVYPRDPRALRYVPYNIAKQYKVFPLGEHDGEFCTLISDLKDSDKLRALLSCEGMPIRFLPCAREEIEKALQNYYGVKKISPVREVQILNEAVQKQAKSAKRASEGLSSLNAVDAVNAIVANAFYEKASDVHIEPFEEQVRVRFRIDGLLEEKFLLPKSILEPLVSRVKILSGMNIAEKRSPQDGRFSVSIKNQPLDCRTSSYPTVHGEKIVLRLLVKKSLVRLEQLGMNESHRKLFRQGLLKPHGLILVTGPTGSGKSTSLYSGLQLLNSIDRNIVSIEDPVENRLQGVNQAQLNNKAKMTFASALKSMMRQDPDVIMVGEIRDKETAEMCIRAALTGHLVLSTLHTNTALGAVSRLANIGIPPFLISSSLVSVLGQRLVRRICESCKEIQQGEDVEDPRIIGLEQGTPIYRGKGCDRCRGTGFEGRLGLFDLVYFSPNLKQKIEENAKAETLAEEALKEGWKPMIEDGKEKVKQGLTTVTEVFRVTSED